MDSNSSPSELNRSVSVLIIGGGTWGSSTALHLTRRGYTNVTVLDPYPLPSPIAAGNDINKIVDLGSAPSEDCDDETYVHQLLTHSAIQGWLKDPIFQPYYHDTGYIVAAHTPDGLKQLMAREIEADYEWLETAEAFRATMPKGILTGDFPGWKGGYKREGAGWAFARGALINASQEARRLGANFITGSQGNVTKLIFQNGDVKAAETVDGVQHEADVFILAAGAQAPSLIDFRYQLRPTAWTLAHIKMTPSECELYKNLPVLFNIESGFFMEPNADTGELKICDEHPGYCNFITDSSGTMTSVPFAKQQIPKEAEDRVRGFLKDTMPQLAGRPFSFARICWCADTPNRQFLIDRHPEYENLILAVGGSGHGFKYMPSIGSHVVDLLEGKMEKRLKEAMCWRPETAVNRDMTDVLDRRGGPNKIMDLQKVREWTEV